MICALCNRDTLSEEDKRSKDLLYAVLLFYHHPWNITTQESWERLVGVNAPPTTRALCDSIRAHLGITETGEGAPPILDKEED